MFEWKTGDEDWSDEEETAVSDQQQPSGSSKRKIRLILTGFGLVLVVLIGVSLAFGRLNSQVTAVTDNLETRLMDVNRLLLDTAVAEDNELFVSLINGKDRFWRNTQLKLLEQSLFLNRAPLGLWLDDLALVNEADAYDIELSSDLTQAEVRVVLPYQTLTSDEQLTSLQLQHTAVYKKQNDAWLLAEPDDEFWGNYVHVERPWLDLITPGRDLEIAEQLADDLTPLIEKTCAFKDINCPPGFVLELRLDNNPESLINLYSNVRLSTAYLGGNEITRFTLPAPTLVGLPVDDASYDVILRGYAAHTALAIMNAFDTGNDGFPAGNYIVIPDFRSRLLELGLFSPWPPQYHPAQVVEPPPVPLPDKEILLMCQSSRAPILFHYNLDEAVWRDLPLRAEGIVNLYRTAALPDGRGVILVITSVTADSPSLVWVNNGRERALLTDKRIPDYLTAVELAPGRYFLYFIYYGMGGGTQSDAAILDESTCTGDACELEPFESESVPSPDGRYNLITRLDGKEGLVFALGDASGKVIMEIGQAVSPLWLDANTLVYLALQEEQDSSFIDGSTGGVQLFMITMPENENDEIEKRVRLSSQDLTAVLPDTSQYEAQQLSSVMVDENNPGKLLVSSSNFQSATVNGPQTVFFHYDWQNDEITIWPHTPTEPVGQYMDTSPNGRFLIFLAGSPTYYINLFDRENERWLNYSLASPRFVWGLGNFAWTEDDEWLLLTDTDAVRLIAPGHDYERLLFHGQNYCETAAWVDWE